MIRAKPNTFAIRFFSMYFRLLEKVFFNKVELNLLNTVPEGSVLLIQNHFSWWDGYWSYRVCSRLLKRRFFVMMQEEQLSKRRFLARTGAFSVSASPGGTVAAIRFAAGILQNSANALTVYPQGEIRSQYAYPFRFKKGVELLLKLSGQPVQIAFAAAIAGFGPKVRPSVSVFCSFFGSGTYTLAQLEEAFNRFYLECLDMNN